MYIKSFVLKEAFLSRFIGSVTSLWPLILICLSVVWSVCHNLKELFIYRQDTPPLPLFEMSIATDTNNGLREFCTIKPVAKAVITHCSSRSSTIQTTFYWTCILFSQLWISNWAYILFYSLWISNWAYIQHLSFLFLFLFFEREEKSMERTVSFFLKAVKSRI